MPSYMVDEGGERTHVVLPVAEYEDLKKAETKLESVRGYAMEMISAMGQEESQENGRGEIHEEPVENQEAGQENHEQAWYQRT